MGWDVEQVMDVFRLIREELNCLTAPFFLSRNHFLGVSLRDIDANITVDIYLQRISELSTRNAECNK